MIWQIFCPFLENVCLYFLLYIYIFNWYFMHQYHTCQGHIDKHGYDSQAFFLVITNEIDGSHYIWLLYVIVDCFSFFIKSFLHFFLYIYIMKWYFCITTIHMKATLINMVMIHRLFSSLSGIRLIKVITFNFYISWGIVCPSIWNVCLHFFLYI